MIAHVRRLITVAAGSAALLGTANADAQVRTFQACSQGPLLNCAGIRLTSQAGVGPSNTNLFEIGIQNLGAQNSQSLATSVYFASFLTGQNADAAVVDVLPVPTATGGASVTDASSWSLFESGDAIFLSALGNLGIGGCAFGAPSNGFGLMGQTCGSQQFVTFTFFTPRLLDVNAISLAGLEFVALDFNNTADSCNDITPCVISNVSVVPEPSSLALLAAGFAGIVMLRVRRRSTREV
ncbi:MAG: PEP-CTERM sorting domain-containing protein [Phycisphaerae bacterium]|nr:PEP-CTERM sorting domain-containing protein [Gemmatimonadaceae bacterium]